MKNIRIASEERVISVSKLVELVYGNSNGAPMDAEFKQYLIERFITCDLAYDEFPDKSTEFLLAIMSDRIGEDGTEFFEAHDIAVHYFMALSLESDQ